MSITDLSEVRGCHRKTVSSGHYQGVRSWGYRIAADEEPGTLGVNKFGRNASTSSVGDVIQDEDGPIVINKTASKVEIISLDAQDNPLGTGAKAVLVLGIDINWNPISEVIVTKGQSASLQSDYSYLYVYRAKIVNSGEQRNAGDLIIRRIGAGITMAMITERYGQTERAVMPVFAGCKLYLNNFRFEGVHNEAVSGELALVEYELNQGIRIVHPLELNVGSNNVEWREIPKIFGEKTLVWIEIISITLPTVMTASFSGLMERYEDSTP